MANLVILAWEESEQDLLNYPHCPALSFVRSRTCCITEELQGTSAVYLQLSAVKSPRETRPSASLKISQDTLFLSKYPRGI